MLQKQIAIKNHTTTDRAVFINILKQTIRIKNRSPRGQPIKKSSNPPNNTRRIAVKFYFYLNTTKMVKLQFKKTMGTLV